MSTILISIIWSFVSIGLTKLYSSLQTESDVNASISLKASAVLFKAGTSF